MSDIRSMLVDTVNKLMKDLCTKELVTEAGKGKWPVHLWDTIEDLGVTSVGIEEKKGGAGGDLGDALALLRVVGTFAAPIPLAETIIANLLLTSANLSIATASSTIAPVRDNETIAFRETADGWVVTGKASFVPWARQVKNLVVVGSTEDNNHLVAIIDPADCIITAMDNVAGEPRDKIVFNNNIVRKQNVSYLTSSFKKESIWKMAAASRVALMTGALEKTLELSVTYTQERSQFGRPISKFQAIQQQLAILAGEVTASMAVADFLENNFDKGITEEEVMMAKIQVGEATGIATRIAHQVHGAMGFTEEHPLHLSTRRLWSWRDEFGTEMELAKALGKRILDNGSDELWPFITAAKEPIHR